MRRRLQGVKGWVFDVDGTLVLGDQRLSGYRALPGAVALIEHLERAGVPFVAFTNGTTKSPRDYAATLERIGLAVGEARMLTPVSVAIEVFRRRKFRKVLVLGVEGVWRPLADAGFEVMVSPARADDAEVVLVGWHPEFGLQDLQAASAALWGGAALYVVSVAPYFASAGGRVLGISGAIVAALRNITGKRATVLGKPSVQAMRYASQRLGVPAAQIAVVGDDPVLEVRMALRAGAIAIGVQTGLNDAAAFASLEPEDRPHLSLAGVHELLPLLESAP
ncbi:MAG TPA: HAD-IIA family hydrolase [Burkholderiales bacterium]|nr:HAD-IIA family hydrolase [Burkholderiales bacterium]